MKMNKNKIPIIVGVIVIAGAVYFGHPHKYKDTMITEPTCTTEGTMQYQCWCGNSYTEQLEALGHAYKNEITVESTCTENGVNTYTCTVCEDTYSEEIDALGHDLKVDTKEATCDEAGYEKNVCSRCNYVEEEVFEALGHNYELTEESKSEKVYVCNNCEDTYTEKIKSKASGTSSASAGGGFTEAERNAIIQDMLKNGATMGGMTGTENMHIADWDRETSVDISGVVLH